MGNLQILLFIFVVCLIGRLRGLPIPEDFSDPIGYEQQLVNFSDTSSPNNETSKNLYVIRAVVYEIGILTDSSDQDNSTESDETRERVDLTFFDAHSNKSHINLGKIPLPVQTNVSGQMLTGIAPVNIGAFSDTSELLANLPLTGTIVNITHSDTAYFRLSKTSNLTEAEEPHILTDDDLAMVPDITDLLPKLPPVPSFSPDSSLDELPFLANNDTSNNSRNDKSNDFTITQNISEILNSKHKIK